SLEYREARAHRELPCPDARHLPPLTLARAVTNVHPHDFDRFDVVAVVTQRVEQAVATLVAPGFGDDHEVGAEAANDPRHVITNTVEPAEPPDPPVCVECRD